jgi:hypothetical protein
MTVGFIFSYIFITRNYTDVSVLFQVQAGLCPGKERSSDVLLTHHVTRHDTAIHNILSTAPQLSISKKALGTLPEDGNVMPKHVGVTIHN